MKLHRRVADGFSVMLGPEKDCNRSAWEQLTTAWKPGWNICDWRHLDEMQIYVYLVYVQGLYSTQLCDVFLNSSLAGGILHLYYAWEDEGAGGDLFDSSHSRGVPNRDRRAWQTVTCCLWLEIPDDISFDDLMSICDVEKSYKWAEHAKLM